MNDDRFLRLALATNALFSTGSGALLLLNAIGSAALVALHHVETAAMVVIPAAFVAILAAWQAED